MIPARRTWKICLAASGITLLLFFWVMDLQRATLRIPFVLAGDNLLFLSLVKGIVQGDWLTYNSQLGMPFGADLHDYPLSFTVEAVVMKAMSLFLREPGAVLNLCWIMTVLAAASNACYGLLRFSIPPAIAITGGVIYALQPATFFRNTVHFTLVFWLTPLLAAAALEFALGRIRSVRDIPLYMWIAVVLQGFSHIYYSFFAVFFLLTAAVLAFVLRRQRHEVFAAAALASALIVAALLNNAPDLIYLAREGRAPSAIYKLPWEADQYGLKLRHLITPIPSHPLEPMRRFSARLEEAHFPLESENNASRLGSVLAFGLILLLSHVIWTALGRPFLTEEYLGPAATLLLAGLLLSFIGGFGSIFNTFIAADIRAYNRTSVFLAFFCMLAVAALLTRWWTWSAGKGWPTWARRGALAVLLILAAGDQSETPGLTQYDARKREFLDGERFVRSIEDSLPTGARIFQLPDTLFLPDPGINNIGEYEHAFGYLYSRNLRWSWAGTPERNGEWTKLASALPPKPMLRAACAGGFQGLWLDEFGYAPGQSPANALRALLGPEPIHNSTGRKLFFDLRDYCGRTLPQSKSVSFTMPGIIQRFAEGFDPQESDAEHTWRWSRRESELILENRAAATRNVRLECLLENGSPTPVPFHITGPGIQQQTPVSRERKPFSMDLQLPPESKVHLKLRTEGPRVDAPRDPRELYFAVADLIVTDK